MAKKRGKDEEKLNYSAAVRELKADGPERLYLLWGREDYLREQYLAQLKTACLPEGEDSFSFKRMDGPDIDVNELAQAVDAMPFLSDRSFVEIRGLDLNKLKDADRLVAILSDIPDYCTVALVQSARKDISVVLLRVNGIEFILVFCLPFLKKFRFGLLFQ